MIAWDDYCLWTHETAMRKVPRGPERVEVGAAAVDDREVAELLEIWGLGLGGELLELIAEIDEFEDPLHECRDDPHRRRAVVVEECGDLAYYLARLYVDTGNERHAVESPSPATIQLVAKHVGRVVETIKKALRKEGRPGVVRLTLSQTEQFWDSPDAPKVGDHIRGRREDFGVLLDQAIGAVEGWLVENGSSLSEVCEANQVKLKRRLADGTLVERRTR